MNQIKEMTLHVQTMHALVKLLEFLSQLSQTLRGLQNRAAALSSLLGESFNSADVRELENWLETTKIGHTRASIEIETVKTDKIMSGISHFPWRTARQVLIGPDDPPAVGPCPFVISLSIPKPTLGELDKGRGYDFEVTVRFAQYIRSSIPITIQELIVENGLQQRSPTRLLPVPVHGETRPQSCIIDGVDIAKITLYRESK